MGYQNEVVNRKFEKGLLLKTKYSSENQNSKVSDDDSCPVRIIETVSRQQNQITSVPSSDLTGDSTPSKKNSNDELKRKCNELIQENKSLKQHLPVPKKSRRNKVNNMQLEWQIKFIAKNEVYPKVKFVTNKFELEDYESKNSLGGYFLKCFLQKYSVVDIGNKKHFWQQAQSIVYDSLAEKRNAVQTAMKKKWIGK